MLTCVGVTFSFHTIAVIPPLPFTHFERIRFSQCMPIIATFNSSPMLVQMFFNFNSDLSSFCTWALMISPIYATLSSILNTILMRQSSLYKRHPLPIEPLTIKRAMSYNNVPTLIFSVWTLNRIKRKVESWENLILLHSTSDSMPFPLSWLCYLRYVSEHYLLLSAGCPLHK